MNPIDMPFNMFNLFEELRYEESEERYKEARNFYRMGLGHTPLIELHEFQFIVAREVERKREHPR